VTIENLGKELELFAFSQKVGQGLPLWLPKGAALRDRLEQFLKKHKKSRLRTSSYTTYWSKRIVCNIWTLC
jgi:threonyl-tRNA synthetase